tara:strand:+ start:247 stop:567 length:321 start_codon:yes stop_codon:yes gene_type:complete
MLENLIKKLNSYKLRISKKYQYVYENSSDLSRLIVGKSKRRVEIEGLKISLKKHYYYLGKHVAKQYISKGYSDFSLDDKFKILNREIKEILNQYKDLKNKEKIKNK